jgi:hypothetical protein
MYIAHSQRADEMLLACSSHGMCVHQYTQPETLLNLSSDPILTHGAFLVPTDFNNDLSWEEGNLHAVTAEWLSSNSREFGHTILAALVRHT